MTKYLIVEYRHRTPDYVERYVPFEITNKEEAESLCKSLNDFSGYSRYEIEEEEEK